METVAIIPARGGSRGIPQKNLMDFCGQPLLAWSVQQARDAALVDQVYVSSDSDAILELASGLGAQPVRRPEALSGDTASSEAALLHALDWIRDADGQDPELLVFLQATSPVREPTDIDGAVRALRAADADSLFSAAVLEDLTAWRRTEDGLEGLTFDPARRLRRQDREPVYLENGSIYVLRPWLLRRDENRLGGRIAVFEMPRWKSFEIDDLEDAELCAHLFRSKLRAVESR